MIDRICIPVGEALSEVERVLENELVSNVKTIDSITGYLIGNGGKRIRPALFLLSSRVVGLHGSPRQAAAIEMLHTASLLHDDVIDDAPVRRGYPSARARWGNQASVLVGDFMLSRASMIFAQEGSAELLLALAQTMGHTTEGELLEIEHQSDAETGAETYMRIISGKTASLFSFAAAAPAITASVGKQLEEAMRSFGLGVGQAFQLTDDALDYVADEACTGKSQGIDLREGKLTYPLIVALSKSTAKERARIRSALISGSFAREEFRGIADIVERNGGIESTLRLARETAAKAKENLVFFKPSIERDSLAQLADYAVSRNR